MRVNWLDVILIALATYRLTRIVVFEDGPFDLAFKFRSFVFDRFDEGHWLNKGLSCPWCVSFWVVAIMLVWGVTGEAWLWIWFGIAGAVSLLFSWEINNAAD